MMEMLTLKMYFDRSNRNTEKKSRCVRLLDENDRNNSKFSHCARLFDRSNRNADANFSYCLHSNARNVFVGFTHFY